MRIYRGIDLHHQMFPNVSSCTAAFQEAIFINSSPFIIRWISTFRSVCRKARAQEKWKAAFMKELIKAIEGVCGENYEEDVFPEETAAFLAACLETMPRRGGEEPATKEKIADGKTQLTAVLS